MRIRILFVCFLWVQAVYSQDFTHRMTPYNWEDEVEITLVPDSMYKNEDAVILFKEITIRSFEATMTHYSRILFRTQKGIDAFNGFYLPQSPDLFQTLALSAFAERNKPRLYFPGDILIFLDARILRDGEIIKAVIKETIQQKTVGLENPETYQNYRVEITNLEPGDELELAFGQRSLNVSNFSLHDVFPIQELYYNFEDALPASQIYNLYNLSVTPQVSQVKKKKYNYRETSFHVEHLPAIAQNLHQPADSMPYIGLEQTFRYEVSASLFSKKQVQVPIRDYEVLYPFSGHFDWAEYDGVITISDALNIGLNAFWDTIGNPYRLAKAVNLLAAEFEYTRDSNYYLGIEFATEGVGAALQKKKLREVWKDKIYRGLFIRNKEDFYLCYLRDNRLHNTQIDRKRTLVAYTGSYAYFIPNSGMFTIPKSHRFGYYANEFPYYFRDCEQILVPQSALYKVWRFEPYNLDFRRLSLVDEPEDNLRKIYANIKLGEKVSVLKADITLSGMFSTMQRGAYQFGFTDSIADSCFSKRFADAQPDQITVVSGNRFAPYTWEARLEKPDTGMTYRDSIYWISPAAYFPFVFPEVTDAGKFPYGYKPAFLHSDDIQITLEFPEEVTEIQPGLYSYYIQADGWTFRFWITRPDGRHVTLQYRQEVNREYFPPAEIPNLYKIEEAMKALQNCRMGFVQKSSLVH